MPRFVVQEHHARSHHFDFRLERGGKFKSWAVPKGLPEEPEVKRFAVQVEDHELSFGDFEGTIPEGNYGAGQLRIWDQGEFDLKEWSDDRIVFALFGKRLKGSFRMVRFSQPESEKWLIAMVEPRMGQEEDGSREAN
jgi:bifunctional non-homologous end joining protein LigD